jgi:alpha/beta superfamily hydrolase
MGGDSSSAAAAAHVVVEKLEVVNAAGVKLVGILEEGRKRREELCILCHGFQSSKELPALVTIAAAVVQEAGMSSFRFDFTGNGESGGEFAYGNYWREVEDLRAVVEFWRARGRRIVALIGHSKGGNAVLLYASKYQDVGIIVNISGRFDLRRGNQRLLLLLTESSSS